MYKRGSTALLSKQHYNSNHYHYYHPLTTNITPSNTTTSIINQSLFINHHNSNPNNISSNSVVNIATSSIEPDHIQTSSSNNNNSCNNNKIYSMPSNSCSNELIDDDEVYYCKRVRRSYLLYGRKRSKFPYQCFVGPDWPCMMITYLLIIIPTVLFIHNVAVLWGPAVIVITVLLLLTTLILFSLTACSDPGIVFAVHHDTGPLSSSLHNNVDDDIESNKLRSSTVMPLGDDPNNPHNNLSGSEEDESIDETRQLSPQLYCNNSIDTTSNSNNSSSIIETSNSKTSSVSNVMIHQQSKVTSTHHNSAQTTVSTITTHRVNECGICKIERPNNASHCYECGFCVVGLDHHCPVTVMFYDIQLNR